MKKVLFIVVTFLFIAAGAFAAPIANGPWQDYEFYQSDSTTYAGGTNYPGQLVQEGQQYKFFFDLVYANDYNGYQFNSLPTQGTDSALSLKNDVEGYTAEWSTPNDNPVGNIWASISIFSVDAEFEQASLDVNALYKGVSYGLTDIISAVGPNTNFATFTYQLAGDLLQALQADPYGELVLSISSLIPASYAGYNDFNLLEVGIGAAPVPEPGTLLLFGFGLVGLGFLKRRKS